MKAMIQETLDKVVFEFKLEIEDSCLCELKTIRYDQSSLPDYNQKGIQLLYLLRYFPAYLCEYKYLYNQALRLKKIDNLSILSIGCGSCIDYYGAFLAKNKDISKISYCGIDQVSWDGTDSLNNPKFKIINNDIKELKLPLKNDYNIIMFPKSISEFDEDSFNYFLDVLSETEFTQNKIFLISSVMNLGFDSDSKRYKKVADFLESIGYFCEKYISTQEIKNKGGLVLLDSEFNYPNEIKDYIISLSKCCKSYKSNGKNCKSDCKFQLDKWPMLKSNYISFQINLFERKI